MTKVSVVVPVRNGSRYLGELLEALRREGPEEVLVVDSGSEDDSVALARLAGATVVEVAPEDFGHGRTRNLAAERTTGELICFLTQDATPCPGWLDSYRSAFAADPLLGAAFGPHLARRDTSPMIARELEEHFAGFERTGDGGPTTLGPDAPTFLSNANACYRLACWDGIRFDDLAYAEDQAFAHNLRATRWHLAYVPGARVLHAHDYSWRDFMRRYFDEYRGLHQTLGHVEPIAPGVAARWVAEQVVGDQRWMAARGRSAPERRRWLARSAAHHGGRRVFSALGGRADRLPSALRRRISLEERGGGAEELATSEPEGPASGGPVLRPVPPSPRSRGYDAILDVVRDGPAPLLEPVEGMADGASLHVAVLIPPFVRGSGGHSTLFRLVCELERFGHTCSIWLDDPLGLQYERAGHLRGAIREWFHPVEGPAFKGFDEWYGADVVLATGWQTVYTALRLDQTRARAYLVQDHEPEFFPTSAERVWAERSYSYDLYCICASDWLLDIVRARYGRQGTSFRLGVDHEVYSPQPVARRPDTVAFYARATTGRRAVALGALALEELARRRSDLRIILFGDDARHWLPFGYEHAGIATPHELARIYSEARVGLCMSMTNYSLIPQEMMACGLPCVDLADFGSGMAFGADGPVALVAFDPVAIADAIERLLDDREDWERRSRAGRAFAAEATWPRAGRAVEAAIRAALRSRESTDRSAASAR